MKENSKFRTNNKLKNIQNNPNQIMDIVSKDQETIYKEKQKFLSNKKNIEKIIFTKPSEIKPQKIVINYNINMDNWRYRQYLSDPIELDLDFLKEKYYKENKIAYSPFLMFTPEELYDKSKNLEEKDSFDYYKRHILLENYDEEKESPEEMLKLLRYNYSSLNKQEINALERLDEVNSEENRIYDLLKYKITCYTNWFDHDGNSTWKECDLVSFNSQNFLFKIRILKQDSSYLVKEVTRFNIKFENENRYKIEKRIKNAQQHRSIAQKYLALYHFISSFDIEVLRPPYELVDELFKNKILYLALVYESEIKKQYSPIEYEKLPHFMKFGIWRRHSKVKDYPSLKIMKNKVDYALKRNIEDEKKKKENKMYFSKVLQNESENEDFNFESIRAEILQSQNNLNEESYKEESKEEKAFRLKLKEKSKISRNNSFTPKQKMDFCMKLLKEFIDDYFQRSFQTMSLLAKLPLNYNLYKLLHHIIPKNRFLIPSEIYLYPTKSHGYMKIERENTFRSTFEQIDYKLHQSDLRTSQLLIEYNSKFINEFNNKTFFFTKWYQVPIHLKNYLDKNEENISLAFKDLNFLIGHSNYEIISFIKERLKEVKKINKGAK